jgi:hypothetical protein
MNPLFLLWIHFSSYGFIFPVMNPLFQLWIHFSSYKSIFTVMNPFFTVMNPFFQLWIYFSSYQCSFPVMNPFYSYESIFPIRILLFGLIKLGHLNKSYFKFDKLIICWIRSKTLNFRLRHYLWLWLKLLLPKIQLLKSHKNANFDFPRRQCKRTLNVNYLELLSFIGWARKDLSTGKARYRWSPT